MKNTIFNKKNIFKIFIIFSFIAMTFGCSKVFDKADDYVGPKDKARITISTTSSSRSAIAPVEYEETITSIILTGKFEGQDKGEIKKWEMRGVDYDGDGEIDDYEGAYIALERDPIIDDLDVGNWEFTLTCYIYEIDSSDFNEIPVYEAKAEKNLIAGDNGSIRFSPSGKGSVKITLEIDEEIGVKFGEADSDGNITVSNYTITAHLKNLKGVKIDGTEKSIDTLIYNDEDRYNKYYEAYYELDEVPAASYIIVFTVQEKDNDKKTLVTELLHVSSDLETEGTMSLGSLYESYEINYYYVDKNGDTQPFNEDWWVSKETIPRTFTEYDKIKLPNEFDILRDADVDANGGYTGYLFGGWYEDSTLESSGKPSIDKIASQSSNKNLYAKFLPLVSLYSVDNFYLGLENPTEFEARIKIDDSTEEIPYSWYDKIVWSSSDNTVLKLYDEQNINVNSTNGSKWFTLKAKALKPTPDGQKVSLIAKIGGKTVVISEILDSRAADALIAELPDEATIFTIPDGYTYIGYEAFKGKFTDKVTSIVIPKSVTSIGSSAFSNCTSLENVYMLSNEPPELGNDAFEDCYKLEAIYVPVGSDGTETYFDKYYEDSSWNTHTDKLQVLLTNAELQDNPSDTVFIDLHQTTYTVIASGAFAGFTKLSSVILPPSRSDRLQIKAGAFKGCNSLEAIQFTSTNSISFNYEGETYTIDIDDSLGSNATLQNG